LTRPRTAPPPAPPPPTTRPQPAASKHNRIHDVVRRIPPGRVSTYGDVAVIAGLPGHARLVGYALHALPDHSTVPWHRVVNFRGGLSVGRAHPGAEIVQRQRLEAEGVQFDGGGRVPLKRFRWQAEGISVRTLATIGYETATVRSFLDALREAGVDLVVDIRAAARSRRVGFAKTRLAAGLNDAGIEYLHLPGLGTPADGRAAARAGHHDRMKEVFREHLATPRAQADLDVLVGLVDSDRRICILCLEAEPEHCHRSLVAEAVAARIPVQVLHLRPGE
jgi:alkylated DNA nucleotide flippase Atl1